MNTFARDIFLFRGHSMYTIVRFSLVFAFCLVIITSPAYADSKDSKEIAASPKNPWGEFTVVEEKVHPDPWYVQMLLWVPNRLMDFIDVFRFDVGVGPTYGAVVRLSKYGQFGYRAPLPASVRIGGFGRRAPVLIERAKEYGVGPGFVSSRDRKVCPGEVGMGADIIVGVYGGVCIEEAFDFIAGLFFIDLMGDDSR